MNSRWLYRAAGTVGLASGMLLLGAGTAQADEHTNNDPELLDDLVGDAFAPTAGLPPLTLTADESIDQTLAPSPQPELLPDVSGVAAPGVPGLGGLPGLDGLPGLGGLESIPGADALAGIGTVPLDGIGVPDGVVGVGIPLEHGVESTSPAPELLDPNLLAGATSGQTISGVTQAGQLAGQVPVAGPMVTQQVGNLPVVGDFLPGHQQSHAALGDPLHMTRPLAEHPLGTAAGAADRLPAMIADNLAAEWGLPLEQLDHRAPEMLDPLSLLDPALQPLSQLVGVGNVADQLPMAGPMAGPALGQVPVVNDAARPPEAPGPVHPAGPADTRPVTSDDPWWDRSGDLR